jgi:hypothetical protein
LLPSERKRRSTVREPIPEGEWRTNSFYYDEAHQALILDTFERKPEADDQAFLLRLEIGACFYVSKSLSRTTNAQRPHQMTRDRESIITSLKQYLELMEKLPVQTREDTISSAKQLARANPELGAIIPKTAIFYKNVIPDTNSETLLDWDVSRWIARIDLDLKWLIAVFEHANHRNLVLKTDPRGVEPWQWQLPPAGNRADEPFSEFMKVIVSAYADHAKRPIKPVYDRTKSEPQGELLDLIHACLSPLGAKKSKLALFKALNRLLASGKRFADIFSEP